MRGGIRKIQYNSPVVLASMTSVGHGQIPLTLIIVGGVCGCAFGFTRK